MAFSILMNVAEQLPANQVHLTLHGNIDRKDVSERHNEPFLPPKVEALDWDALDACLSGASIETVLELRTYRMAYRKASCEMALEIFGDCVARLKERLPRLREKRLLAFR